jgi:uncharacterized OB-fold protein
VLAYVDLDDGVRILGEVVAGDQTEIGMRVALRVEAVGRDPVGDEVLGYRFHPLPGGAQ